MTKPASLVAEGIAQRIHLVRGCKVMLDADLAALYNVETRALVQAVKRNSRRFPQDFMFQLTDEEWAALRSQFGTSTGGAVAATHRTFLPSTAHSCSQLMGPSAQRGRPIGFVATDPAPIKPEK